MNAKRALLSRALQVPRDYKYYGYYAREIREGAWPTAWLASSS